jgi:hypothetical protein
MTASRTSAPPATWPEPPPRLLVALEWSAASGELDALRVATGAELHDCCAASAAAYRAALVTEGGPADDATVTEALLAELAAWLRALDDATYTTLAGAAARGPLGSLDEC